MFANRILMYIALVTFFGCKNSTEDNQGISENIIEEKNELIIDMEFKTDKEDVVIISLDEIQVDDFQKKSIQITESVFPTTGSDRLLANFGEGNISRKLTIDLGSKELKEFEIISIRFKYGNKSVDISTEDIEKYFALSKFTVLNKENNKIQTKKVDGYHYPKLYLRGILWDQLTK